MESLVNNRVLNKLPALGLAVLGVIVLMGLVACHQNSRATAADTSNLDWQVMAFTCTTEQNPPVDPEADVWIEQARTYEKQGDPANDAEILRLYQQAAGITRQYSTCQGLMCMAGGVPRDEGKAVDPVEQGLQMNAPHAYYLMGVMLQQGIGVKPDKAGVKANFRHGNKGRGQYNHEPGYDHQKSYQDERTQWVTLYSIIKIAQLADWRRQDQESS